MLPQPMYEFISSLFCWKVLSANSLQKPSKEIMRLRRTPVLTIVQYGIEKLIEPR